MDQRSDEQHERHEGLLDRDYSFTPRPSNDDLQRQIKQLDERVKELERGTRRTSTRDHR